MAHGMRRSSGSYELVLAGVAFAFLGFLVDSIAGTRPAFLLTFAAVGFLGAAARIYFGYKLQMEELAEEARIRRNEEVLRP
jgi:F0F1-type ATP synthase assembly protein I